MKKYFVLVIYFLFLLAACEAEPTLAPNPPSGLTPAPTDTIRVATPIPNATRAPATFVPSVSPAATRTRGPGGSLVIAGIGKPSREITQLPEFVSDALFDSLLRVDPEDGHLLPGLAERWLVSEDAKTFVFKLRDGVEWSDGEPLTADDVAFTIEQLSNPDIRVRPAADFGPIDEVTATDERTVSITFRQAYCAALTYIGILPILPKHKLETDALINVANENLIGTGPLVLEEWNDEAITFTRNANYWNGAPQIVNWTYRIYADERAARNAVAENQADLIVTESNVDGMRNAPMPENAFYALAFNTDRPPFDDVKVRQAIAMGLDRTQLAQANEPAETLLESSLLAPFWAAPQVQQPAFDVTKAQQALTALGWRDTDGDKILDKDGKKFQMTLWAQADEPMSELMTQRVREQLARIGAEPILKMSDRTLFLTRVFLHEYDLALVYFNIPLDPDQHYFWAASEDEPGYGLNVTGYNNAAVEAALAAGNQAARCDMTGRKNAYAPLYRQIAADTPMLFMFAPTQVVSSRDVLAGTSPSAFAGAYWNLNTWTVAR